MKGKLAIVVCYVCIVFISLTNSPEQFTIQSSCLICFNRIYQTKRTSYMLSLRRSFTSRLLAVGIRVTTSRKETSLPTSTTRIIHVQGVILVTDGRNDVTWQDKPKGSWVTAETEIRHVSQLWMKRSVKWPMHGL